MPCVFRYAFQNGANSFIESGTYLVTYKALFMLFLNSRSRLAVIRRLSEVISNVTAPLCISNELSITYGCGDM